MSSARAIDLLAGHFAICRLDAEAPAPEWATRGAVASITRTPDELSIVCADAHVPPGVRASRQWRALRLRGPLDVHLVGVLLSVATPLAAAGVSIMTLATFDTDYVFVRDAQLAPALAALRAAGHEIHATTTAGAP